MSFLDNITARIPFGKKEEVLEYYFALNISNEKLSCALWTIDKRQLKILGTASSDYSSLTDLTSVTDKLLDKVLGDRDLEPQKILFGVPNSWLLDGNLKEEFLKTLRNVTKELELTPMAYVENSLALVHFLEKTDGIPPTAILVGFETHHLTTTVVRAGKVDGVKVVARGENSGADTEKALLTFVGVETLPSKLLIYELGGEDLEKLKAQLLSFSWMSKLSFLHFPKIEILPNEVEIKSICLAGGSEIESSISYNASEIAKQDKKSAVVNIGITKEEEKVREAKEESKEDLQEEDLGFVVGDVSMVKRKSEENELTLPTETNLLEVEDFELEKPVQKKISFKKFLPKGFKNAAILIGFIGILLLLLAGYLLLPKAQVKIFVEPKILEKDTQVTADPNQKTVDEDSKIIPGKTLRLTAIIYNLYRTFGCISNLLFT